MKCLYCQGQMERGTAPFRVDRKGYHLTWETLPAWVCTQCGEVYFEETEIETIQAVARLIERKTKKLHQHREKIAV
jgi:YgiT-type zinc finger domain-containing protein